MSAAAKGSLADIETALKAGGDPQRARRARPHRTPLFDGQPVAVHRRPHPGHPTPILIGRAPLTGAPSTPICKEEDETRLRGRERMIVKTILKSQGPGCGHRLRRPGRLHRPGRAIAGREPHRRPAGHGGRQGGGHPVGTRHRARAGGTRRHLFRSQGPRPDDRRPFWSAARTIPSSS